MIDRAKLIDWRERISFEADFMGQHDRSELSRLAARALRAIAAEIREAEIALDKADKPACMGEPDAPE